MSLSPETIELIAKIVAFIAAAAVLQPHLQALLQKRSWSPAAKAIITIAWSILFGIGGYVATLGPNFDFTTLSDPTLLFAFILGAYQAATNAYARLWKPLETVEKLEDTLVKDKWDDPKMLPPEESDPAYG